MSTPETSRVVPRRVLYLFAGFFLLFCVAVFGFWVFGGAAFSVLLQKTRAYTPPQFLTWLSLAAALSTSLAFCIMPFSLFRIVKGRPDVPFGWLVLCVAGFLFLLGLSGFIGLFTLWSTGPIIVWVLVLVRVAAALLAVGTLFILRAMVPRILEIPTQAQWLEVNNELLRAEADSDAKNRLLATVSHELRTPLAPLLATLTELEQQVRDIPAARASIDILRRNIHREARLVSDLLDKLELPAPEMQPAPPATTHPQGRPQRLLVVEDHLDTLRTFARILRARGFEVAEAASVAEAIRVCRPGDFLLSDIALPDGDGRDLMRQLSARGIPGIAISGFGTAKDREEYRRAGFAESLVKPVDIDQVVSAIGRVTGAVAAT